MGEAGGTELCHEYLRLTDLAGVPINDRDLLAGIAHEHLVADAIASEEFVLKRAIGRLAWH